MFFMLHTFVADDPVPAEWLDAVRLLAAFEVLGKPYQMILAYEFVNREYQDLLAVIRQKMAPAAFEAVWQEGRNLAGSLDEAIQYALATGEKYAPSVK